jgi:hypothetical protein
VGLNAGPTTFSPYTGFSGTSMVKFKQHLSLNKVPWKSTLLPTNALNLKQPQRHRKVKINPKPQTIQLPWGSRVF